MRIIVCSFSLSMCKYNTMIRQFTNLEVSFSRSSPFHRFYGYNNNLVPTLGTKVSFAAGTGKTVAARFFKLIFVPAFSAMGTGN